MGDVDKYFDYVDLGQAVKGGLAVFGAGGDQRAGVYVALGDDAGKGRGDCAKRLLDSRAFFVSAGGHDVGVGEMHVGFFGFDAGLGGCELGGGCLHSLFCRKGGCLCGLVAGFFFVAVLQRYSALLHEDCVAFVSGEGKFFVALTLGQSGSGLGEIRAGLVDVSASSIEACD